MDYKDYKKDYAKLMIGIIIIIIGTFWFVSEINERKVYTHALGIATSSKDEMSNVRVQYDYGFNTYEGIISVPKYVNPKTNEDINVMFDKNNINTVLYGKDTRIYATAVSLLGIIIFLFYMFKIQTEKSNIE